MQLEVPFISYFRKEEYTGILTQEQLRWLIELDLEYVKMTKNKAT